MRVFGLMPWLLLTENSLPSARSFPHFWHPFRLPHFLWNTSYLILYFLTVVQAARVFLSSSGGRLDRKGVDIDDNHASFVQHYLNKAISLLSCDVLDGADADSVDLETLEEPFFSKKFAVLIDVLSRYRIGEHVKEQDGFYH